MTHQQLWQAALGEIEILLSKPQFNTWFKQTFIISHENERLVVEVPNTVTKSWFEKKFNVISVKALRNVSQGPIREVIYKVDIQKNSGMGMPTITFTAESVPLQPAISPVPPMMNPATSGPSS